MCTNVRTRPSTRDARRFEAELRRSCSSGGDSSSSSDDLLKIQHFLPLPNQGCCCFVFSHLLVSVCCLYFSAFFSPSANSHLSLPPLSAGQINSVPGSGRKAQRVQLVSISRQGGKDDREGCWNESSVWAPTLFSLSY